jgi:hypothetical protein
MLAVSASARWQASWPARFSSSVTLLAVGYAIGRAEAERHILGLRREGRGSQSEGHNSRQDRVPDQHVSDPTNSQETERYLGLWPYYGKPRGAPRSPLIDRTTGN